MREVPGRIITGFVLAQNFGKRVLLKRSMDHSVVHHRCVKIEFVYITLEIPLD